MDKLTDVGVVQTALAEYKDAVTTLKSTIEELQANRSSICSAWQSNNADALNSQYGTLISSLEESYASLAAYQQKIDAVVQEFVGFDETIN